MAVYRRGYQRYQGAVTGHAARLLVLPRFAWQRLLQQRLIVILLVAALFWPVGCALFIYLSNHTELLQGFGGEGLGEFLRIDSNFFTIFMTTQSTFAILLAAFAGPSLIAPDLANGALPLYFSRPMSRPEYVLARLLVLIGLLSPVTWIPGLFLFFMQTGMAGWTWFTENWDLGLGVFAGFLLWIGFVSLVAMASSAYVKWRIVAGALVLGIFFVAAGAAELTNAVLRVEWASAFNPARSMFQIWRWMLGADPLPGPEAWQCAIAISVMAAFLLFVLERKLRPVEVVR
jgi:ABC-2 type transport system permease protein